METQSQLEAAGDLGILIGAAQKLLDLALCHEGAKPTQFERREGMPLIILSGRPCTGKSRVAGILAEYLKAANPAMSVVILNDESLGIDKSRGYISAAAEKISRATLKAAIERAVTTECTVIADGLNYIKGFRYELYCIVRSVGSTHCCVFVDAPLESARAFNLRRTETRLASDCYSASKATLTYSEET